MASGLASPGTISLFYDLLNKPGLYSPEERESARRIIDEAGGMAVMLHADISLVIDQMKKKWQAFQAAERGTQHARNS